MTKRDNLGCLGYLKALVNWNMAEKKKKREKQTKEQQEKTRLAKLLVFDITALFTTTLWDVFNVCWSLQQSKEYQIQVQFYVKYKTPR